MTFRLLQGDSQGNMQIKEQLKIQQHLPSKRCHLELLAKAEFLRPQNLTFPVNIWEAKTVKEEDIGFLSCSHLITHTVKMGSFYVICACQLPSPAIWGPVPRSAAICPSQSWPFFKDKAGLTPVMFKFSIQSMRGISFWSKKGENVSVPRWHLRHTPAHCPEGSRFVLICGKAGFRWQKWPAESKHTASDLQICKIPRAGKKPNWFFTLWGNKQVDLKAIM